MKGNELLLTAMNVLSERVGSTMGPNGYNVSIGIQRGIPHRITKDGATVARNSGDDNQDVNGFIKCITEVAQSVETEVGDGTTTATVMSTRLITELMKLKEEGIHPRKIMKGMNEVLDSLIAHTHEIKQVTTSDDLFNIAKVSTNHDIEMAKMVKSIIDVIGPHGRFQCHEGHGDNDIVNTIAGYTIDGGIIHEALLANQGRPRTVTGDVTVIEGELSAERLKEIISGCDTFNRGYNALIIACDSIVEQDYVEIVEQLTSFNSANAAIYPLELSHVPMIRVQQRDDINGIQGDGGITVTMERKRTTFQIDTTNQSVMDYIEGVDSLGDQAGSGFDLEMHKERMQRLRGGYATIMAAGQTDAEAKERSDRIADALLATQSALREGYVLGGGNHYLELLRRVETAKYLKEPVRLFLTEVFRRIHLNSGCTEERIEKMITDFMEKEGFVFDCLNFNDRTTYIPMDEFDVIDSAGTPVRVFEATRSLMNTLLPINHHIEFSPTKFDF